MRETIKHYLQMFMEIRLVPILVVYVILFAMLVNRLFQLQIVEGDAYAKESEQQTTRTREIRATRGNIYDCNGKLLAYNELSHNVVFEENEKTKGLSNEEKNDMIYRLLQIIEKNGGSLSVEFYIQKNKKGNFEYTLSGNALLRFKKEVFSAKQVEELTQEQRDTSASDMFEFLRYDDDINSPRFMIDDKYDEDTALNIMAVRYAMFMNRFKMYETITLASNVDDVTVAAIKENSVDLPGVDISDDTTRVYKNSKYFAHILGYTGNVTTERLDELAVEDPNSNYTVSDQIGISGIESSFEEYLRGTKGNEKLVINSGTSRVLDVTEKVDPVAGNDLYLTIDANLQKECYDLLEEHIAGILLSKISNGSNAGTRGHSASDIRIPIFDVYNALIQNNVIDVTRFTEKDASSLEKITHKKYKTKSKRIIKRMKGYLAADSKVTAKSLSDDMEDFMSYFYTALKEEGLILTEEIDTSDSTYKDYLNDKISLSTYLQYAISENWVDLSVLKIGAEYYSTEEIYGKLVNYGLKLLEDDTTFIKMVYSYLIYHYEISGIDCCLLLFDQGDIKYNADEYRNVKLGMITPYSFLTKKIRKLEITPGQLGLDPCSGSLVVTDINTGDVKAMVSYPSYDNNKMANQVDSDYFYSYLTQNTSSPLLNRPTQQKIAPGSTFKIVSSVTALEEGIINTSQSVLDKVEFDKINPSPHCWSNSSHGNVNVPGAIEVSCNYFFYEMGYRLSGLVHGQVNNDKGLARLKKYADMFGLTETSGVELTESEPNFSKTDAVRSAIGQATHSYAPIQLSRYVTTIANNGTCYNLTLVDQVKDVEGSVVLDNKAKVRNKVKIAKSTWNAVHDGMYRVVSGSKSSISSMFANMEVQVAGKTGTAQQNEWHANHAYFISYAPYEKPEISVTCVIPNGYTSSNAAQTARDVYKYYFDKNKKKVSGKVKMPESNTTHTD
ncbi:MAG: hypothetical protein J1E62_07310 [Lachnospiraceae bacterium]|nr:hypothetical protein [Lachnospiraceae bacterium]